MTTNKGLPPGWRWEVWQNGTKAFIYDPALAQLTEAPRWTDKLTSMADGVLGRIYGPSIKINPKDIDFKI